MAMLTPMNELEAINRMLSSIGQAPVNTLDVSGIGDVDKAKRQLKDATRDISTIGWSWNTDEDYPLQPDADGIIVMPLGALDADPMDKTVDAVIREHPTKGPALYNKAERSFVWDEAVPVRIIWGIPFDELPQAARSYVATAAARRFQAQVVSSRVLDAFNQEDQDLAWLLLMRRERATRDTNSQRANPTINRFHNRRRF